ncbi:MAG: STAS/SEC14 domain-containing protein [Microcoleaceae cyanobacterium MO_207.B10]|nr:STAS/SEC14 domain-containing protein [Microcoleaceae cyanobacterium MO_207.B10]
MIEIIPIENQNIVGFNIDGKIESSDIEKVTNLVEERLKSETKLRIYVEVKNIQGISLEALWQDLKFGLRHLKDFQKKAVVCEESWMTKLAAASNKIFTNIEVKCFSFSEKDEALEWVKN